MASCSNSILQTKSLLRLRQGHSRLVLLKRCDRADVRRCVDAARALSRGERCAGLGVDELARDQDVGAIPELDGELGAGLLEDQLDERRRIEVDDQRR